ncbi:MAG: hypothetical protein L6R42_007569 [Xanthoria sp. 1 TBL-2021]|nr:MAG: hypothetical protein L6R42_007569 [Xanthoria sp. 1 TBL-2021]
MSAKDARAPIPIASNNVLFHDPEMNEEDVKFLETVQGYRVMRNLDMGWMIRRDVFVYTPCATFDHIEKMIRVDWPAVFVGVDYKGWPETLEPKEEYDDAKNEKLRAERQGKRKIYREVFGAYFATLTSQELLVMKESYQFPTVTAYCTRISG